MTDARYFCESVAGVYAGKSVIGVSEQSALAHVCRLLKHFSCWCSLWCGRQMT